MKQKQRRGNPLTRFFSKLKYILKHTEPRLIPLAVGKDVENSPIFIEGTLLKTRNEPMNLQPHGGSKYILVPSDTGLGEKQPISWKHVIQQNGEVLAHLLIYEFQEPQQ